MNDLRYHDFNSANNYLKELRVLQQLAGYTMLNQEPMLNREMLQNFLKGLPENLRYTVSLLRTIELEILAEQLDDSAFMTRNLTYQQSNKNYHPYSNNRQNCYEKFRSNKYCRFYKSKIHSDQKCTRQNQQNQHDGEVNKLLAKHTSCPKFNVSIGEDVETIQPLLDTGSTFTLISPDKFKALKLDYKYSPKTSRCGNNALLRVNYETETKDMF